MQTAKASPLHTPKESHTPNASDAPPPPAYAIPALQVLRDSFHRLVLVDPTTQTPLYKVHNSSWTRCVDVSRPSPQNHQQHVPVGSANFHSFTSEVDIKVHERQAVMARRRFMSTDSVIQTPMFEWTWQTVSFSSDLRLVDQTGQVVADYESASFSLSKRGTLYFRVFVDELIRDWVVVTAMAKIEQGRRSRSNAVGAAAA
ncbi:hypothetical protein EsDP_00006981 [Epichloe bromicola]|uniref:DUF6593 domain-containing protein n=1 Tax=Epichloe bromicola TaxID=79588 RepID=A0ABQ0CZN4_9HYPO